MLDYTSATLRVAVKHPPNNSLKLGKKTKLKAERIGAFAAKPLGESPRSSSHGGIFEFQHLFYTYVLSLRIVSGGVFLAPSFFCYSKPIFQLLYSSFFT